MASDNKTDYGATALTTILVVSDIDKSRTFYVDVLGASVYRTYEGNSVVLQFLNTWLLLVLPGDPTKDKPEVFFAPPAKKSRVSQSFTLRVDDCQKAYEILKDRGAEFITPPVTSGAETRCFFHDPDGHLLEISEYKS